MARSDTSVTVAYVHSNEVAHSWHLSLMDLVGWDLFHHQRVITGGWMGMRCGTDGLPAARNTAVARFLSEKDSEWLFWIDTDMGFDKNIVDELVAAADPVERPFVGALCFAQRERATDGMGGYRCAPAPTIYDWVSAQGKTGFMGRAHYPINSLIRCAGTGSAAVLIHRSVFERVQEANGPVWYDRVVNDDTLVSEDLSFCMRAAALDIPVHVHSGIRTTHLKQFWLSEEDFWQTRMVPPATEPTAVLVPVMRRPQNAEPFMQSLRASTGLARVYVLADAGDIETTDAWRAAGANEVWTGTHETFAKKINEGFRISAEPWMFLVGDDVRFHPGWLDQAQAIAGDTAHVVGTNDLANPRTMAGEHSPHLLVRRSYADEVGASWDGPKVVCHEGYRHWWVDEEIVTAAKARGVWAMALSSNVEHLHPLFGTAELDDVYRLGQSNTKQDFALWRQRLATHAPDLASA